MRPLGTLLLCASALLIDGLLGCKTTRCKTTPEAPAQHAPLDLDVVRERVWETECAFAATMQARDHESFTSFLSEDVVFFVDQEPLRGKQAVADAWKPFFEGPTAPFAWEPERVEPLASGELALSTGPVTRPNGDPIGRFLTIWRFEAEGWRVVLDRGE